MPLAFLIVGGGKKGAIMCGTTPGAKETFSEQVCMPINGRVQCIDRCIHHIVAALNAANVATVASCCGHHTAPGSIILDDGRCIGIFPSLQAFESAAKNKEASGTSTNNRSQKRVSKNKKRTASSTR